MNANSIVIVACGLMVCGLLLFKINLLEDENNRLQKDLTTLEAINSNLAHLANQKVQVVEKEVEVIKWKTLTKIETIKEFVRDENESTCTNALNLARAFL